MGWTFEEMDRMFNPRVVAVVGAKRDRDYNWIRNVLTLRGKVYSVQIDPSEIPGIEALGVPNVRSLTEIPEPVDHVIVAVPRAVAPRVLQDALRKGVNSVMFYTSGFAETDEPEGIRIQQQLAEMAREGRMKVVGPNCMGLFNPRVGLRFNLDQYHGESGNVGFISQSGTHATIFSLVGYVNGIRVSKAASMGNGIVLHAADYLEYFEEDPETEVVAMYVEGVPDGRRFFQVAGRVARKKPLVIWKGGQTAEGARAAHSHTASMAAPLALWQAMARQVGAVMVETFDELIDVVKALTTLPPPAGPRMGLVATTGGQSVVISDSFARAGLQVPLLADATYEAFASFFSTVGGSYRNPLDMSPTSRDADLVRQAVTLLAHDPNVDAVCYELNVALGVGGPAAVEARMEILAELGRTLSKPLFAVVSAGHREEQGVEARKALASRGVAAFPSFQRAATAYRKLLDYHLARRELAAV